MSIRVTFDPAKREVTLRGIITAGYRQGRMVMVVWTPRGNARHVISMRKANERESARYAKEIAARWKGPEDAG